VIILVQQVIAVGDCADMPSIIVAEDPELVPERELDGTDPWRP